MSSKQAALDQALTAIVDQSTAPTKYVSNNYKQLFHSTISRIFVSFILIIAIHHAYMYYLDRCVISHSSEMKITFK